MKLGKIEFKKYKLTDEDYQDIYEMYKGGKMYRDIAEKYKLSNSKISALLSHINAIVMDRHIKFHKILDKHTPNRDLSSIRDLMFPCDNHPTVGTVVIKNGEIIHDGNNVTEQFKTLKHFY